MKIIDELACPIDYDCYFCKNFYHTYQICFRDNKRKITYNQKFISKRKFNRAFILQRYYLSYNNFIFTLCPDYQKSK